MYLSTSDTYDTELPRDCTFSASDWHILAALWHPVAFSKDVDDKPLRVRLLDTNVVVYRTIEGVTAAKDVCVHRGAALSLGSLDCARKNIVCPFHGLHYDHTGQCTRIPSLPDQSTEIPKNIRLTTYQTVERYGLIWVCMKDEARWQMPEWPLLEQSGPEWQTFTMPQGHWNASASRHCENFNDVAHFSWVHTKTFGNPDKPEIPSYDMERTDYGLRLRIPYPEVLRSSFDVNADRHERDVYYTKELTYPFATDLILEFQRPDGSMELTHIYDIGTPVSARETAIFQIIQTNVPGAKEEDFLAYQGVVNSEDIPFVESQRPEEVPLNIAAEIHIPADKFSVQYRKDLAKVLGLGAPSMTA